MPAPVNTKTRWREEIKMGDEFTRILLDKNHKRITHHMPFPNEEAPLLSKNEGRKMYGGSKPRKFFAPHFSTDSFRTCRSYCANFETPLLLKAS
jgi:hypothetical protein